ncbi:hypothetical protein MMC16_004534 [Acarospora aff. strigata]|nr:hypothetical protein [Acarospora aff. strigata]
MEVPWPAVSVPSTSSGPEQGIGYTEQVGGSTLDLTGDAASRALPDSEVRTSPEAAITTTRYPPLVQQPTLEELLHESHAGSSLLQPPCRVSYSPAVPSLLSPTSRPASFKSRDSTTGTSQELPSNGPESLTISTSKSSNGHSISAAPGQPSMPSTRRGEIRLPGVGNLRHQQASPSPRPQTPLSLGGFDRVYSRYPSRSARTPQSTLSPAPPFHRRGLIVGENGTTSSPELSDNRVVHSNSAKNSANVDEQMIPSVLDDLSGVTNTAGQDYRFPIYIAEKEADDDLHMPYPDDDKNLKPKLKEYLAKSQLCSLIGMLLMMLGLAGIFVVLPVLCFTGVVSFGSGSGRTRGSNGHNSEDWAFVNAKKYPLFSNLRTGLIDPTTPTSAMTRRGSDGKDLQLVFSDEFNGHNRTFYPGDDPFWTAPDLWYGATQDLEWYDPDAVTTSDGTLLLQLDKFPNHNLQYRSGMLNSWNQICFKGGALEVSMSLAGPAGTPGLWPGAWTMGNLGRPGYKASTDGVWPYTYDSCDAGITPNQSSTDGLSGLPGQRLPSCVCPGADHPTPGTGRGAPEIDVIEAGADPINKLPLVTQSYQVAPFDVFYRPNYDFLEIPNYNTTQMNGYCGGPFQQAISGTTTLNRAWYDGEQYQKYAFEYTPGIGRRGQISWSVGDEESYRMTGDAVGPNGNIGSRIISEEPMSIILNLGISNSWTQIDWANLKFPTTMRVDYVRWYQKPGEQSVTCDPEGYETTEYIRNHPRAYQNYNLTVGIPRAESSRTELTLNSTGTKRATDGPNTSSTAIAEPITSL